MQGYANVSLLFPNFLKINLDENSQLKTDLATFHHKWLVFEILDAQDNNYIATVRINAFLLAVGPQECRVEIKSRDICYGILLFKCSLRQIQQVSISLNRIKVTIDGLVPDRITTDFTVKVPAILSHEAERPRIKSGHSIPMDGRFTRLKKAQTKFSLSEQE